MLTFRKSILLSVFSRKFAGPALLLTMVTHSLLSQAAPLDSLTVIAKESEFQNFANHEPGGIVRSGQVMKFLVDNRKNPDSKVYFLNSNYCAQLKKKADDPTCSYVLLHRNFANHHLNLNMSTEEYFDIAYNSADFSKKKFIDGRVQVFDLPSDPQDLNSPRKSVYGVWFIERDLISEQGILFVLKKVRESFQLKDKELMFVQFGEKQTTATVKKEIGQLGIAMTSLDKILMGVEKLSLNVGVGYGFLRLNPKEAMSLEPTDIPVFNVLPLDLGVVAGTITTTFQDVASHINLKAKERKTPNVVILSPQLIKDMEVYKDQPIRLTVTADSYSIDPSSEQEVLNHQPKVEKWLKARTDLKVTEPLLYSEMCQKITPTACLSLSGAFGGKAMQLGFLSTSDLLGPKGKLSQEFKYPLSPLGFGVPVYFYHNFLVHNRKINPELDQAIKTLNQNEIGALNPRLTSAARIELLTRIRELIRNGEFPDDLAEKIYATTLRMRSEVKNILGYDLATVKVRSSANVEDIAGFDGAGLHDSYSARVDDAALEKSRTESDECKIVESIKKDDEDDLGLENVKAEISPKTIICAIKGVYASIYNLRAVSERSYRGFDHDTAMMGIAIVPSYKGNNQIIENNSVLLTRVLNTTTVYGYQLATQRGNNLATNPIPGTMSEMAVLAFEINKKTPPTITIQRHAKVDPAPEAPYLDTPLLTEATVLNIQRIARTIEEAYCVAKKDYYDKCTYVSNSSKKPKSLDMEIKIYKDQKLLFKQFREFSGR